MGAKVTFRLAVSPGARIVPEETPVPLKPEPETLTVEIVTYDPLELVSVTLAVLVAPRFNVPKFTLLTLAVSCPGVELTESSAGPLVTLPAASVTTTVNNVPFCDAVTVGDVYEDEVAPGITVPFDSHW
jgi:hypothetical protein